MSYQKAMKHARNVRKLKKQSRQCMGFDTGSGHWPAVRSNPYMKTLLEVRDWFKQRHVGDFAHNHACILEAIAHCRTHAAAMREAAADRPAMATGPEAQSNEPVAPPASRASGPSSGPPEQLELF